MLVVRVEVWPAGREADAFEIGRMEVTNESSLSAVSDYSAHIVQRETPRLKVAAFDLRTQVCAHVRSDGPWALVKRVLDQLRKSQGGGLVFDPAAQPYDLDVLLAGMTPDTFPKTID